MIKQLQTENSATTNSPNFVTAAENAPDDTEASCLPVCSDNMECSGDDVSDSLDIDNLDLNKDAEASCQSMSAQSDAVPDCQSVKEALNCQAVTSGGACGGEDEADNLTVTQYSEILEKSTGRDNLQPCDELLSSEKMDHAVCDKPGELLCKDVESGAQAEVPNQAVVSDKEALLPEETKTPNEMSDPETVSTWEPNYNG